MAEINEAELRARLLLRIRSLYPERRATATQRAGLLDIGLDLGLSRQAALQVLDEYFGGAAAPPRGAPAPDSERAANEPPGPDPVLRRGRRATSHSQSGSKLWYLIAFIAIGAVAFVVYQFFSTLAKAPIPGPETAGTPAVRRQQVRPDAISPRLVDRSLSKGRSERSARTNEPEGPAFSIGLATHILRPPKVGGMDELLAFAVDASDPRSFVVTYRATVTDAMEPLLRGWILPRGEGRVLLWEIDPGAAGRRADVIENLVVEALDGSARKVFECSRRAAEEPKDLAATLTGDGRFQCVPVGLVYPWPTALQVKLPEGIQEVNLPEGKAKGGQTVTLHELASATRTAADGAQVTVLRLDMLRPMMTDLVPITLEFELGAGRAVSVRATSDYPDLVRTRGETAVAQAKAARTAMIEEAARLRDQGIPALKAQLEAARKKVVSGRREDNERKLRECLARLEVLDQSIADLSSRVQTVRNKLQPIDHGAVVSGRADLVTLLADLESALKMRSAERTSKRKEADRLQALLDAGDGSEAVTAADDALRAALLRLEELTASIAREEQRITGPPADIGLTGAAFESLGEIHVLDPWGLAVAILKPVYAQTAAAAAASP